MSDPAVPPSRRVDLVRDLLDSYRRACVPPAADPAVALAYLLADLIHLARRIDHDPVDAFVEALLMAGQGDNRPWNAPEQRTYYSILVAPVDGITSQERRDETADLEVVVMRHDELMTRTSHRRVVTGLRGDADYYHDHELLPPGPIADAAFDLWEQCD